MESLSSKKPVVYIVGPTASGKTALSVDVAKHFGAEIISGDSMQIYKDMHIASAAPDIEETKGVPHHLFEFLDRNDAYSVSQYVVDAGKKIDLLHSKSVLPIVVGGTGLYITSLAENIYFGEDAEDKDKRLNLEKRAETEGLLSLYETLEKIDPETAKKISPNDKKRIIRALEVYEISGMTMSQRVKNSKKNPPKHNNIFVGLTFENRELLYDRINRRVDIMLKNGLLEEAKKAFENGGKTSVQAIGHKEFFEYFKCNEDLKVAVERLKMQTRRYAKRQLTWFRNQPNVDWIYMDKENNPTKKAIKIIENKLKECAN